MYRARTVGCGVVLLRVIEPVGVQEWASVGEALREEARAAAAELLNGLAAKVREETNITPDLIIREGSTRDEILALIQSDPSIRILVLAAAPGSGGPGPLVSALAGEMSGNMTIPITVVPGSLTDAQIDALT
jgi:nucleotide-binding universal stress UspA family protein